MTFLIIEKNYNIKSASSRLWHLFEAVIVDFIDFPSFFNSHDTFEWKLVIKIINYECKRAEWFHNKIICFSFNKKVIIVRSTWYLIIVLLSMPMITVSNRLVCLKNKLNAWFAFIFKNFSLIILVSVVPFFYERYCLPNDVLLQLKFSMTFRHNWGTTSLMKPIISSIFFLWTCVNTKPQRK